MGQPQLKVLGWAQQLGLVCLVPYTLAYKWNTETLRGDCHPDLLPSLRATTPPDAQLSTITIGPFPMCLLHSHLNPPQCVTHMGISLTRVIPSEAQPGLSRPAEPVHQHTL